MNADHRGVSRNALYKSMLLTYLLTYLLKGPIFFEAEVVFPGRVLRPKVPNLTSLDPNDCFKKIKDCCLCFISICFI